MLPHSREFCVAGKHKFRRNLPPVIIPGKSGCTYTVQSGEEKGLASRGGLPDCTLDLNTEGGGGREAICRVGQAVWKFAGSVFFTVSSRLSSDGEREKSFVQAGAGGNVS
ncbi:hypothetical protein R1flu_017901 [Riccia fluitans]|uniref:Uncharacterized protein n=1 Tax=Riccia fluitans TaxID=41844 RepID=A0ABD1ZEJ1_9MARC